MIVAIELRNCSRCSHWRSEHLLLHKDGYAEAMCDQPDNAREKTLKRGSDYCQHWHKPPLLRVFPGTRVGGVIAEHRADVIFAAPEEIKGTQC